LELQLDLRDGEVLHVPCDETIRYPSCGKSLRVF